MKTRQAILTEPGRFDFREVDLVPDAGQVLVKVVSCGLCNFELNHWRGQLGTFPQTVGHEWNGVVAEIGKGVTKFKPGDKVAVQPSLGLAGFADYALNTEDMTCKLTDETETKYAIAEPVKCTTTVARAAAPEAGDFGAVVGCGPMGLWTIMALAAPGLGGLIAVDTSAERLALAKKYGATHTLDPRDADFAAEVLAITGGHGCDFIVEGTGAPGVLQSVFPLLRQTRGRVCMMSSPTPGELDLFEAVEKGAIISMTHPSFSLDQADDLRRAVTLINNGTYHIKELITHEFPLSKIQQAFETYSASPRPQGYLKGLVYMDE